MKKIIMLTVMTLAFGVSELDAQVSGTSRTVDNGFLGSTTYHNFNNYSTPNYSNYSTPSYNYNNTPSYDYNKGLDSYRLGGYYR